MGKIVDITGLKFNRLLVVRFVGIDKNKDSLWLCKCDCGNEKIIIGASLKNGNTKGCGCLVRKHGLEGTQFYRMWGGIKARCDNVNNLRYKNYGGRGITYDTSWKDFINFKRDMYFKYLYAKKQLKIKKLSIERINNNRGYYKENCTFIERNNQGKNTTRIRKFIAISPNGKIFESRNYYSFAKLYNLDFRHICDCLNARCNTHKKWRFKYA